MPKASEVLLEAAKILERPGYWCKGADHEQSEQGDFVAHCAIGGLEAVCFNFKEIPGEDGIDWSTSSEPAKGYKKSYPVAVRYLSKEIVSSKLVPEYKITTILTNSGYSDVEKNLTLIVKYNDGSEGTQKNVVKLFKKAARIAAKNGD